MAVKRTTAGRGGATKGDAAKKKLGTKGAVVKPIAQPDAAAPPPLPAAPISPTFEAPEPVIEAPDAAPAPRAEAPQPPSAPAPIHTSAEFDMPAGDNGHAPAPAAANDVAPTPQIPAR